MLWFFGILLILVQTVMELEGEAVIVVPYHLQDLQQRARVRLMMISLLCTEGNYILPLALYPPNCSI